MVRRVLFCAAVTAGLVVAACEDGTGPTGPGSLTVKITVPEVTDEARGTSAAAENGGPRPQFEVMGHLTGARVSVQGPTSKSQDLTASGDRFTGTVDGLEPGSYAVTVVGLVGTEVDHFGRTSGVQVQAGRTTTASISFPSFRPAIAALPTSTTFLTFRVTWPAIAAATEYRVEWSRTADFADIQSQNVTTNQADITVGALGDVFVRAVASNDQVSNARASDPVSTNIVTDIPPTGDDLPGALNLGFGTAANGLVTDVNIYPLEDFDVFRIDGCAEDEVRLEVYARRLTPPSELDPVVALFDGAGNVLGANDDIEASVNLDSRLILLLPADGDYYPVVVAFDDPNTTGEETVGAYELEVEVTPGAFNTGSVCGSSNLEATSITGDGSATAGDIMRLDLVVDNLGDAAAPAGWVGHVMLSTDNVIDATDRLLQSWTEDTDITALGSKSRTLAAVVPDDVVAGSYFLGVIADVNDDVIESDESNNVVASTGTVSMAAAPFPTHGSLSSLNLHTCRLDDAGQAKCWGDNLDGELGDGTLDNVNSTPVTVVGGLTFEQIVTGRWHTCGVTPDHDAYCWGWNGDGRLGDDPNNVGFQVTSPTLVTGGLKFVRLVAGWDHTCGIALDGSAWCWGQGSRGELGDGTFSSSFSPIQVAGPPSFWNDIAAGDGYTCAVDNSAVDGTVYCWGDNTVGQLGDGTTTGKGAPVATTAPGLRDISIANWHTCGINAAGDAYCWGLGTEGELGDGLFANSSSAVLVSGLYTWNAIVAGWFHTCGVQANDEVWCWGSAEYGQLGDGSLGGQRGAPTGSASGTLATALALGSDHTCAKQFDGTYTCWGRNHFGQLGNGATLTNTPRATSGMAGASWVAAGWEHSCGMIGDQVWCWGSNGAGALGDGGLSGFWSTTPVSTGGGMGGFDRPVSAQWAHTCAVNGSIEIYCWGFNSNGQIGDGTTTDRSSPTLVSNPGVSFAQTASGNWHTCALTSTGDAYCWGANFAGQLGDGTQTDRLTPVGPVGTFKVAAAATSSMTIAAGDSHTCAIDANDDAWCWGANGSGQLGDGSVTDRWTPVLVQASGVKFNMITAGDFHTCAVATDGTGWCWGSNNEGELGDGNRPSDSSTPIQIAGGITWAMLSASNDITCGLDLSGNAYCWGLNFDGQLGDGTFWDSGEPSPVQTSLTFTSINAGNRHVCAVATDATGHCWGGNRYGQIGDGTQNVATTPVGVLTSAPRFTAQRTYMAPTASGRRAFDRSTFGLDPDAAEGQRSRTPVRR